MLPKRSYATFRYMYPIASEERQKHVEWETFVVSMADAGFTARNGGGSIVTFEDENGGGKIIFHRPHPEPTIDPVMLQSMGRRMNKWFDWTRETFALAGK
ncbi:Nn.00g012830.m01.CDS01 [Neocucurbitaria sp. VM-36]